MKRRIRKIVSEVKHNKEFYTLLIGGTLATYIYIKVDNYRIYKACHRAMRDALENWEGTIK